MADDKPDKPSVTIYTDGGCDPNPGPGGWGVVLIFVRANGEQVVRELKGGEPHTTNNRMELTAAIQALRALKQPCVVEFHTDSQYVQKGISQWMATWERTNFKKGKIQNVDLWQALKTETARHDIRWHWVRGHAGNTYNERADQLAMAAIREMRSAGRGQPPPLA
jgi:ribonuclease HI